MARATYQITLRVDGNHAVSVSGDDPIAVQDGLAWARGISLKLQDRARPTSAAAPHGAATVFPADDPLEQEPPTCAIHTSPMVSVQGQTGQFWSCHEKLEDGSWCSYKPLKHRWTTRQPRTITLTATAMRRQLTALVEQIREHGLRVVVTRRGVPIGALVPLEFRPGRGVTIAKRGKPIAKVVGLKALAEAA